MIDRDTIALALLPGLLRDVSPSDVARRHVLQSAFALADDFLIQRHLGMPLPGEIINKRCVAGRERHHWLNGICVNCKRTMEPRARRLGPKLVEPQRKEA